MRIVDLKRRKHIRRLQNQDPPPPKRKRARKPADFLLENRDRAGAPPSRADWALVHRAEYGRLTLDKTKMLRRGARRIYQCYCRCGNIIFLTASQLLTRAKRDLGCLSPLCEESPVEVRVWHNPRYALWVQLSELLAHQPGEVANEWGGTLYEGIGPSTPEQGAELLWAHVRDRVEVDKGVWWLTRINPKGPWADFNIRLTSHPDRSVFPDPILHARYGDAVLRLDELAELFGVDEETVTRLRAEIGSDEQLIDAVIEHSLTPKQ